MPLLIRSFQWPLGEGSEGIGLTSNGVLKKFGGLDANWSVMAETQMERSISRLLFYRGSSVTQFMCPNSLQSQIYNVDPHSLK